MNDKKTAGFTLLEVIIAVFILAVGVLGVSATQMISLKNNQSSYYRSQANFLAMDILDRMRANPTGVQNGNYASIDTTGVNAPQACTAPLGCTTAEVATLDKAEWSAHFDNGVDLGLIPEATGDVATVINAAGDVITTVTISWTENGWDDVGKTNIDATKNLVMTVRL